MAKIPPEIFPVKMDPELIVFCKEFFIDVHPILVPIHPWSEAKPNECFDNVDKYISKHGGKRLLGWRLMRWANIMIEAEAHAIWQSPIVNLIDITPTNQFESLFLLDSSMKYNGHPIPSLRKALTGSNLVSQYIDNLNCLDILRSNSKAHTQFDVPTSLFMQLREAHAIFKTDVGRNDLCPCQSGLKFKKCCGRF